MLFGTRKPKAIGGWEVFGRFWPTINLTQYVNRLVNGQLKCNKICYPCFCHFLSIFSLNIDTLFPKQQVETLNPPSVSSSHYDNQLASDSIKSAIGMSTQQSQSQQLGVSDDNKKNSPLNVPSQSVAPSSSSVVAPGGALPQRQAQRQQRSKLPPPSTKVCLNYRHLPWRLVQSLTLKTKDWRLACYLWRFKTFIIEEIEDSMVCREPHNDCIK